MNYPIVIAGTLTVFAFLAHVFIGIRETYDIAPDKTMVQAGDEDAVTVERNWVQALCAFQMVTIDLLVLPALLFTLVFWEGLEGKKMIALGLSIFYALWGAAWLIQLLVLKRPQKDLLMLGQWILWFICAGLIYWGAQGF